jgi:hypothetical protein
MMEIRWTNRVRKEVLYRVKEEMNIVHAIKERKANCLLKHVIEGEI